MKWPRSILVGANVHCDCTVHIDRQWVSPCVRHCCSAVTDCCLFIVYVIIDILVAAVRSTSLSMFVNINLFASLFVAYLRFLPVLLVIKKNCGPNVVLKLQEASNIVLANTIFDASCNFKTTFVRCPLKPWWAVLGSRYLSNMYSSYPNTSVFDVSRFPPFYVTTNNTSDNVYIVLHFVIFSFSLSPNKLIDWLNSQGHAFSPMPSHDVHGALGN